MIRVLLVDDHDLIRTGIRHVLEAAGGIRVVGECSRGEDAVQFCRKEPPDVVLMDVHMPGLGGLETSRRILQSAPDIRIVVLTVASEQPLPVQLMKIGVSGYLTKGCQATELVGGIRSVFRGQKYLSPPIAQSIALAMLPGEEESPLSQLSTREMEVLLMVVQGHNIRRIADTLCISPKTVGTYRHRLFEKLKVDNDVELTRLAMRYGVSAEPIM